MYCYIPFDLNVLCTPPAFILSQDQTLEKIVFETELTSCLKSFRAWFALLLCLSSNSLELYFSLELLRFFRTYFNFKLSLKSFALYFISYCSIFNDRLSFAVSRADLFIISHSFRFVKRFLKSFLNFFQGVSRGSSAARMWSLPKFFRTSLLSACPYRRLKACDLLTFAVLFATACILYHKPFRLSRGFSKVF